MKGKYNRSCLERVSLLSRILGISATRVDVRDLGYRWGSCGKNSVVYFNWKLLQLPARIADYVIAHELAHLLAQQATEKAIKAVLIKQDVKFPYIHDLAELLTLTEDAGIKIPKSMKMAGELSKCAVFTRYPFESSPIVAEEYKKAVKIAEAVAPLGRRDCLGKAAKIAMPVS